MSFDPLHIQLDKLTYRLQKWQFTRIYSVERKIQIKTADKTRSWNFSFELHLEHLGMENGNHLIKVSRKKFKTNGKEPDLLIARLTYELQKSIYPIVFSVDQFGRLTDLVHFEEIKENWKQQKEEVRKVQEGHGLEALIEQMELGLKTKATFFQKMISDASVAGLFLPVYRHYGIAEKIENEVFEFPFLSFGQLIFQGELKYRKEGNGHISRYEGKFRSDDVSEQILQSYFKTGKSNFSGKLRYERNTGTAPFLRQSINLEIRTREDEFFKEEVNYNFLRLNK